MKYFALIISLLIFNLTPTYASFIHNDTYSYTSDTLSNLDWFDVTET